MQQQKPAPVQNKNNKNKQQIRYILSKGGETLQYRVNSTLLPDLKAITAAGKLYGDFDNASNSANSIRSGEDIDFILVANRPPPNSDPNSFGHKSVFFRFGNAVSRFVNSCCKCGLTVNQTPFSIKEDDFERLRRQYLEKLQKQYGLTIVQVDLDDDNDGVLTSFYLIKGAFAHFGLMAQLMSYEWALNDELVLNEKTTNADDEQTGAGSDCQSGDDGGGEASASADNSATRARKRHRKSNKTGDGGDPRIVRRTSITPSEDGSEISTTVTVVDVGYDVFKSFYFYKRGQERYHEYKHCQRRLDFQEANRYDLMYHLLVGATISMPRLLNPWRNICNKSEIDENRAGKVEQPHRNISLMQLLADEVFDDWLVLHERLPPMRFAASNNNNSQSHPGCCASCCYPFVTCQCCCTPTGNNFDTEQDDDRSFKDNLCNLWRSFWYRNLVGSADVAKRPNENDRSYLYRISTIRNAVLPKRFGGTVDYEERFVKLWHILPLGAIRRYFGEKIAFYFAWVEFFTFSLGIPAAIGAVFFIIALIYYAINETMFNDQEQEFDQIQLRDGATRNSTSLLAIFSATLATNILAKACDNYATPVFAAIMLFWGASFVELWHRRSCWYSWLWRVDNVEATEFERPKTNRIRLAKTLLKSSYGGRYLLYVPSLLVTLFFCCLVFASVYFINVINVASFPFCLKSNDNSTITSTTSSSTTSWTTPNPNQTNIISATSAKNDPVICTSFDVARVIANSISTMILDFCYTNVVYILTDLECHDTKTQFTDALILKLFVFRFVNAYTVLFFIAFGVAPRLIRYPTEIVGELNAQQRQLLYGCDGNTNCMALLTKQLLGSILTGPLIKSIQAVVLPRVRFMLRLLANSIFNRNKRKAATSWKISQVNKIGPENIPMTTKKPSSQGSLPFLAAPTLADVTPLATAPPATFASTAKASVLPPINIRNNNGAAQEKQPTGNHNNNGNLSVISGSDLIAGTAVNNEDANDNDTLEPSLDKLANEIENQYQMPVLSTLDRSDFTQDEFMDRVIMYGALLMFSVALPPAPLLALIILRVDAYLDILRMVSEYRRPLPFRVQDIGIWEKIVNFLTYCGVLTNPLVVILTSSWGSRLSTFEQFWTFLLFEHGMFFIRMLAAGAIDEQPPRLAKAKMLHKRTKDELLSAITARQQNTRPTSNTRRSSLINNNNGKP